MRFAVGVALLSAACTSVDSSRLRGYVRDVRATPPHLELTQCDVVYHRSTNHISLWPDWMHVDPTTRTLRDEECATTTLDTTVAP